MSRKKKLPPERIKLRMHASDVSLELVGQYVRLTAVTYLPLDYTDAVLDEMKALVAQKVWPPPITLEMEVEKPEGSVTPHPSGGDDSSGIPSSATDEGNNFPPTS